jgi:beta-barrel assembly-enhancing protease
MMKKTVARISLICSAWLLIAAIALMPISTFAQTQISYHSNRYKPQDDVRLGREAAAEAERQLPILRDAETTDYLESVGQRLVAAIPPQFQHPEFHYYFKVVEDRQINAFALPGGPMYVNTGTILAAHKEGELAGVMAHELSHVALRHGTAQATKAQKYSIFSGVAGIAGTILAGPTAGQLAQLPVAASFLRFSREYETEADLLGARIMSRAGYDPRDLATMFKVIEAQGGGGGGFLSDHPSPKDRYAKINNEAQSLRVVNLITDDTAFHRIQERLRGYRFSGNQGRDRNYPPSENNYPSSGNNFPTSSPRDRVEFPSSRYRSYTELRFLRLSIPDNWRELSGGDSVWFAPEGGYGTVNGQPVYTYGMNFGTMQTRSRNLQQATNDFINTLEQANNNLRARADYERTTLSGRPALTISFDSVNEATGQPETITVSTTKLRNGDLFYAITVSSRRDFEAYHGTFNNVLQSIRLTD